MHALRTSSTLARLVLAWFVLTLGVALASPAVQPQAMDLVCSGSGGMKLVVPGGDDAQVPPLHAAMDCPMCLPASLTARPVSLGTEQPPPGALAVHPIVAARIAALVGAPLPPRGPPSLS